ncbi:MAG: Bug family tripartite tricarboxylate transporter substrate binding protein [Chloroflexota bacterium]
MKRLITTVMVGILALSLLLAGCSQAAPAPTATPAASTKAAEPTKAAAPAAAPTKAAEPVKKVDFPQKGKAITLIVAWPAGGGVDIGARLLSPLLEKELGVPIQIVNKVGASGQVGEMELIKSKPDGYTIGTTLVPGTITVYLDPERKAPYGRKDFQPLAIHVSEPGVIAVKGDSPYKTAKELIEAAKTNPEKVKMSSSGIMSPAHMGVLQLQKVTGAKFAIAQFEGAAPAKTALLGGHVDVNVGWGADYQAQVKSGDIRLLGIMDKERSKFYPNVPTLEEQGYKVSWASSRGYCLPAGTPKEIVDVLSAAFQKTINSDEHKQKAAEAALPLRYMDPAQYASYWEETEGVVKPLMESAK